MAYHKIKIKGEKKWGKKKGEERMAEGGGGMSYAKERGLDVPLGLALYL